MRLLSLPLHDCSCRMDRSAEESSAPFYRRTGNSLRTLSGDLAYKNHQDRPSKKRRLRKAAIHHGAELVLAGSQYLRPGVNSAAIMPDQPHLKDVWQLSRGCEAEAARTASTLAEREADERRVGGLELMARVSTWQVTSPVRSPRMDDGRGSPICRSPHAESQ